MVRELAAYEETLLEFDSRWSWPEGTHVLVQLPATTTATGDGRLWRAPPTVVPARLMTKVSTDSDVVVAVSLEVGWRVVRRDQILGVVA